MSSNETELDRRIIEANRISMFGDLTDTPGPDSWGIGFCSRSIGGDEFENGGFFWFKSKSDLFDYVSRQLVFANYQMLSPNPFELASKAAAIVGKIQHDELSMEDGLDHLNFALRFNSEIQWWGQFRDLVHGSRPYERKMRLLCRSAKEKGNSDTSAITPVELERFLAFIQEYTPPVV